MGGKFTDNLSPDMVNQILAARQGLAKNVESLIPADSEFKPALQRLQAERLATSQEQGTEWVR